MCTKTKAKTGKFFSATQHYKILSTIDLNMEIYIAGWLKKRVRRRWFVLLVCLLDQIPPLLLLCVVNAVA